VIWGAGEDRETNEHRNLPTLKYLSSGNPIPKNTKKGGIQWRHSEKQADSEERLTGKRRSKE
jgi:hypothetical protein